MARTTAQAGAKVVINYAGNKEEAEKLVAPACAGVICMNSGLSIEKDIIS